MGWVGLTFDAPAALWRGSLALRVLALVMPGIALRGILSRYGREGHNTDIECVRHFRELRVVREVGLEQALGLGNTSDFRGGRVRRM